MLKQRIEILRSGGVITRQTAEFVNDVIDLIQGQYPQVDADHAAMFTTHLAMAMERIAKGELVDEMDPFCWEQVRQTPEYPMAEEFCGKMLALCPVELPPTERDFILLHVCSMLEQENG